MILDEIIATARRMSNLVNDLLDIASIRDGRLQLKLQEVDVAELIKTSVNCNRVIWTAEKYNTGPRYF